MAKYRVTVAERWSKIVEYKVEAESDAEARKVVSDGDASYGDTKDEAFLDAEPSMDYEVECLDPPPQPEPPKQEDIDDGF